ncbi:MAG: hypothetical protein AAGI01_05730, partial [Myxococcota bacterium]
MSAQCDPVYPRFPLSGRGRYEAAVAVMPFDAVLLSALLPEDLELGAQSITVGGSHPLIFLFGHQRGVRPNVVPLGGWSYLEFISIIPFVRWRNERFAYRGPFAYMPRLFLDQTIPTIAGHLYGYTKRLARLSSTATEYRVHSMGLDKPIVRAELGPSMPPTPPAHSPNFAPLRPIFDLPLIAQYPFGAYVSSFVTFALD